MLLLAGGGLLVETAGAADENSPKSAPKLLLGFLVVTAGFPGGDVCGMEAGLESKKPPPLSADACLE
jgi:hypothetical protein